MKTKKMIKNEKGFTLIEIIAVIIIMGILAAVAVPKFFSMQEDAKNAAIKGGLSEAASRFNHAYSRFILDNKRAPTGIAELQTSAYLGDNAATGESIGDFVISWTSGGANTVTMTVISCTTIPDLSGLTLTQDITNITWSS